jgi:quercetin dioxygenase-like cupin family protein
MFYKNDDSGFKEVLEGIRIKTLVYGDRTLLTEFRLSGGKDLPRHAHVYEQTGYLVKGRIRIHIGDQSFEAEPGDSWTIPGNVEHGADSLEDSMVVEVFSPVREDYLPQNLASS